MRVTSRTPDPGELRDLLEDLGKARLTSRPRVCGTTQKEQTLSQPFITVTNSVTLPRRASPGRRGGRRTPRSPPRPSPPRGPGPRRTRVDHLRQLGDGVRPEDEVEVRDLLEQLVLLLLGDAAADGEEGSALGLDGPVAPEGREHLVLGLLPDGAGVEDDEVRAVRRRRGAVADGGQRLAHPERVVDVHLAAEGVDEVSLHGGPGTGSRYPGGPGGINGRALRGLPAAARRPGTFPARPRERSPGTLPARCHPSPARSSGRAPRSGRPLPALRSR